MQVCVNLCLLSKTDYVTSLGENQFDQVSSLVTLHCMAVCEACTFRIFIYVSFSVQSVVICVFYPVA